jgi:hypothetical protein
MALKENKMEDKKAKFIRVYANIPARVRKDILVVVDKEPYTWETAYFEIKEDSTLGKKILKTMQEIEII